MSNPKKIAVPVPPGLTPAAAPAVPKAAPQAAPKSKRTIPIALPNLVPEKVDLGHWYWVGALPECPRVVVHVAGIEFPKVTETVRWKNSLGVVERTKNAGVVLRLTETKLHLLADRLARGVVRPSRGFVTDQENTHGQVVLDAKRPLPAAILTIPTEQELAAAAKRDRATRPFCPQPGDRPLADFIYLQPLAPGEKVKPRPADADLPPPLSVTGIVLGTGPSVPESAKPDVDDGHAAINARLQPKAKSMLASLDERAAAAENGLLQ